MKLQKTDYIIHSLELPISKKFVNFRPWNMREHKILLMAYSGADPLEIRRAIRQILTNIIVDDTDVSKLPIAEAELLFINARAKSVGEVTEINLTRNNENRKISLDLTTVKIQVKADRNLVIPIINSAGEPTGDKFIMKEPSLEDSELVLMKKNRDENLNEDLEMASLCVSRVCSGEEEVSADEERDQIKDFIESMTPRQYLPIDEFLDGIPKLRHEIDLGSVFKDAEGKKYVLEGLEAFF